MICTVYGHQTGTGCTTTAANLGQLLCQFGLRVLVVDFDLSAPGLERYFSRGLEDLSVMLDRPGLVDLITSYKRAALDPELPTRATPADDFLDLIPFLIDLRAGPPDDGQMHLMTAGRRAFEQFAEYAALVAEFDWREFYERWEGELFFRWLRQQVTARFDMVLLDVTPGMTPCTAIACYQLADVVLCLCGPRQQQLDGVRGFLETLRSETLVLHRQGMPLLSIVVPCRVDNVAELRRLREFRERFKATFSATLPERITFDDLWLAAIPNIPFFANEDGALLNPREPESPHLWDAYRRVAGLLCQLAPSDSRLAQASRHLQLRT